MSKLRSQPVTLDSSLIEFDDRHHKIEVHPIPPPPFFLFFFKVIQKSNRDFFFQFEDDRVCRNCSVGNMERHFTRS
ncbi:Uncharacterized protein APZ42_022491 [Daphnia magna]|uniref:Uncharacterized protein n=1 Tax=Daphnia magna TaxID=35525 RepID=A0A164VIX6_9CRUS|nr:Uncharacterized protein APZ42_022491 [Daphnia magna]